MIKKNNNLEEQFARFCDTIANLRIYEVDVETIASIQKEIKQFKNGFFSKNKKTIFSNLSKKDWENITYDLNCLKSAIVDFPNSDLGIKEKSRKRYFYYLYDLCERLGIQNNSVKDDFFFLQSAFYRYKKSFSEILLSKWKGMIEENIKNLVLLRDESKQYFIASQERVKGHIENRLAEENLSSQKGNEFLDDSDFREILRKTTLQSYILSEYENINNELENLNWKNITGSDVLNKVQLLQNIKNNLEVYNNGNTELFNTKQLLDGIEKLLVPFNRLKDLIIGHLDSKELELPLFVIAKDVNQGDFLSTSVDYISALASFNKKGTEVSKEQEEKYIQEYNKSIFQNVMKSSSDFYYKITLLPYNKIDSSVIKTWIEQNNKNVSFTHSWEDSFLDKEEIYFIKKYMQLMDYYLKPLIENEQLSDLERQENLDKAKVVSLDFASQIAWGLKQFNNLNKDQKKSRPITFNQKYYQDQFLSLMMELSSTCSFYGSLSLNELNISTFKQWIAKNETAILLFRYLMRKNYSFCDKSDFVIIKNRLEDINKKLRFIIENEQLPDSQKNICLEEAKNISLDFADQINRNLDLFNEQNKNKRRNYKMNKKEKKKGKSVSLNKKLINELIEQLTKICSLNIDEISKMPKQAKQVSFYYITEVNKDLIHKLGNQSDCKNAIKYINSLCLIQTLLDENSIENAQKEAEKLLGKIQKEERSMKKSIFVIGASVIGAVLLWAAHVTGYDNKSDKKEEAIVKEIDFSELTQKDEIKENDSLSDNHKVSKEEKVNSQVTVIPAVKNNLSLLKEILINCKNNNQNLKYDYVPIMAEVKLKENVETYALKEDLVGDINALHPYFDSSIKRYNYAAIMVCQNDVVYAYNNETIENYCKQGYTVFGNLLINEYSKYDEYGNMECEGNYKTDSFELVLSQKNK